MQHTMLLPKLTLQLIKLGLQVRMIDEAESTLSNADNASDRLVQNVLKQAHQSGSYSPGAHLPHQKILALKVLHLLGIAF